MATAIYLEDWRSLPERTVEILDGHAEIFAKNLYIDEILGNPVLLNIFDDIRQFIRDSWIVGYHCTKEPTLGYYSRHGLRITELSAHQEDFIKNFGHIFSEDELSILKSGWGSYFNSTQTSARNGRLWACFSRSSVLDVGTQNFFRVFGGEAIYKPFLNNDELIGKLEKIGRPVVVEFEAPGRDIQCFDSIPKYLLGNYHKSVNSIAIVINPEGFTRNEIKPCQIRSVIDLTEYKI